MSLRSYLFPAESRFFHGQRWVNVALRTLHLVGIAGLGAGFLYPAADEIWRHYLTLTLLSGAGLALIFAWSNGIWIIQLRGQIVLLKLLLLALMPVWPDARTPMFILIIVLSGWISHATANVRYYSIFHQRRVERLP
jgi:hypothetical protein